MFYKMNSCLHVQESWKPSGKLKLNPDKLSLVFLDLQFSIKRLNTISPVNELGNLLHPAEKVRNVGVFFDGDFSCAVHVSNVARILLFSSVISGVLNDI